MRLPEGIVLDVTATFGELKFSSMRRERFKEDASGELTSELMGRTYDLKCRRQGEMIQVALPPNIEKKDFPYNAVVEVIEPQISSLAERGNVTVFVRAKDIVLKGNRPARSAVPEGNSGEKKN
jgi:Bacterial protein of unknown function (DUF961).